jgi:dienelactone hydrolase
MSIAVIAPSVIRSYGRTMRIEITPDHPALDTVLHIRLTGYRPGDVVRLRAAQPGWSSEASFPVDAEGTVDLGRDAPTDGSYEGVDPMGPVWSMRPTGAGNGGAGPLDPVTLTLTAGDATATVDRHRVPAGLARAEVTDGDLFGVLYHPVGATRLTTVVLMCGAEGGIHEDDAALVAAHGFTALALAVYGAPGRPPTMKDVPVEYFGRALDYLRGVPAVDPAKVVFAGGSKGGEAALVAAAEYPGIAGVVSIVGSGVMTQGIDQSVFTGSFLDIMTTPVANWTRAGEPLPYVPNVVLPELEKAVSDGQPVRLRDAFEPGLELDVLDAATIPVERISGPVLLLSAEDDGGYGPAYHRIAADRLAAHGRPHEHVVYPGAGHLIAAPPYGPTTLSSGPGPAVTFEHGGSPAATASARADTHRRLLAFLADL